MTSGLQAVSKETDLPFTGDIYLCNTGSKGFYRLPPLPVLSIKCMAPLQTWARLPAQGEDFLRFLHGWESLAEAVSTKGGWNLISQRWHRST